MATRCFSCKSVTISSIEILERKVSESSNGKGDLGFVYVCVCKSLGLKRIDGKNKRK